MGNLNKEEEIKTDAVFPHRTDKLVTKIPDRNKKGCIYFGSEFGGISIHLSGTVRRNRSLLTGGCGDTIPHTLEDQLTRFLELRTGLWLTSVNQAIAKATQHPKLGWPVWKRKHEPLGSLLYSNCSKWWQFLCWVQHVEMLFFILSSHASLHLK